MRFIFLFLMLVPLIAGAQGLVPCGGLGQKECTYVDFVVLANNVIDFVFTVLILPLVAIGVLAAGITILLSGGSESQIKKGRDMLWNLLIGFLIAATAWLIINTILEAIARTDCNFLTKVFVTCPN